MNNIRLIEQTFTDGRGEVAKALSSFSPLNEPANVSHIPNTTRSDDGENGSNGNYLPCHYFDYICGTSTGG
jgi:hypothetical protein